CRPGIDEPAFVKYAVLERRPAERRPGKVDIVERHAFEHVRAKGFACQIHVLDQLQGMRLGEDLGLAHGCPPRASASGERRGTWRVCCTYESAMSVSGSSSV